MLAIVTLMGDVGGTFDFGTDESPKFMINIRSRSWDASGVETTIDRVVWGRALERQPFPNQSLSNQTDNLDGTNDSAIVLSSNIYTDDIILGYTMEDGFYTPPASDPSMSVHGGGVNSSTRAYPKCIATWLEHDLERIDSSSFDVSMSVAQAYAQQGQPVRAIKFIATDISLNASEVTVSVPTEKVYSNGSGLTAPCFTGTIDATTLNQGEVVTLDAIIYPWVGDSFQVSVDASAYPSPNLTTLKWLNDRTGAYGLSYSYVDPISGNDGTAVTDSNPATAQASPYLTLPAAVTGLQTYNNTNYSRNNASGGTVRLEEGTTIHASYSSVAVDELPVIIEAADAANRDTTIYQDAGASVNNGCCDRLEVRDVTMLQTGTFIFIDMSASGLSPSTRFNLKRVRFDNGGNTPYSAWIYRHGMGSFEECVGDDVNLGSFFSTVSKGVRMLGCAGDSTGYGSMGAVYQAVGCRNGDATFGLRPANANNQATEGAFFGWNFIGQNTNGTNVVNIDGMISDRGIAIVGNIFEQYGGTTGAGIYVYADGNTDAVENVVDMMNTSVGSRTNWLYNDVGVAIKHGYSCFSIHDSWNTKTDIFGTDGTFIGNWTEIYHVNHKYQTYIAGSAGNDSYGIGSWLGEIAAVGTVNGTSGTPLDLMFKDDASANTGTGLGNGDYTPLAGSPIITIPAGQSPYDVDLSGNPILDDGTALTGAIQFDTVSSSSTDGLSSSSSSNSTASSSSSS